MAAAAMIQPLIGLVAILFAIFCACPTFDQEISLGKFERQGNGTAAAGAEETVTGGGYVRTTQWFSSKGERLQAWLYLPRKGSKGGRPPPVVVMAHGLGTQKDMGLQRYAEAFATSGIATFVFDYRNFGGSDGEPRNLIDPRAHVADYQSAMMHIWQSALDGKVDPSRLALWGTSFSGGHVLQVAAEQKNVSCVISQMPHLDGAAASKRGLAQRGFRGTLRMAHAALKDHGRALMGLSPAYIKIAGKTGELALMVMTEEQLEAYFSKHPKTYLGGWQNKAPARIATQLRSYSPIKSVHKVEAPLLLVGATKDVLCPVELVRQAAAKAQQATIKEKDCSHFEIYGGDHLSSTLASMIAFLKQHLAVQ